MDGKADYVESTSAGASVDDGRLQAAVPLLRQRGLGVRMDGEALVARRFCTLRRFSRGSRRHDPRVLLVSPLSGQRAALLHGMAADLLPAHRVHITDWTDAAAVPVEAGRFGWDEMIAYLIDFLRILGPSVHVVGMSQSGLPVLTVAAAMAASRDPARPRSVTLMGGLIDTAVNPTTMNRAAAAVFGIPQIRAMLTPAVLRPVLPGRPGFGRLVYPAEMQRAGLLLYLFRRMGPGRPTPLAAFQKALIGDGSPSETNRSFYETFLDLTDLPGELYVETMDALFGHRAARDGRTRWRGRVVDPTAIADTALMTVEAEYDDISGRGQTHCAHDLCPRIPETARLRCDVPSVGHLGMFHGRTWRREVMPRFAAFVRSAAAADDVGGAPGNG